MVGVDVIVQQTIYGLSLGGILALVSLGLSLTFGKLNILNLAHGLLYAIGAYATFTINLMMGNFWLGLIISILICLGLGALNEVFVVRILYGKSIEYTLVATFAVLLIGIDLIKWIWGVGYERIGVPEELSGFIYLGSIAVQYYRIFVVIVSFLIYAAVILFLRYTQLGNIVVAFIDNDEHLEAIGINSRIATLILFTIGSGLAGLGGALHAPTFTVYPYMPFDIILLAFATTVSGGVGSIGGTLIAGLILGLAYSYASIISANLSVVVIFLVMAFILIFKPSGLLGSS